MFRYGIRNENFVDNEITFGGL